MGDAMGVQLLGWVSAGPPIARRVRQLFQENVKVTRYECRITRVLYQPRPIDALEMSVEERSELAPKVLTRKL